MESDELYSADVVDLLRHLEFEPVLGWSKDDLVMGATLLIKYVDEDGDANLLMRSTGLNWMERLGAVAQAEHMERTLPVSLAGEDD